MKSARISFALAAFFLFTAVSAVMASEKFDPRTAVFDPPAFAAPRPVERELSGGAKLFLHEDRDVPLVRIYFAFAGGEINDPDGKEGLAYVTGAVWRSGGTLSKSSEEFEDLLEARGVELGLSLGRESGSVSMSVLSKDIDYGLDLLAELVFSPAFSPDRFKWAVDQKKQALKRERDDPGALAFRELRRALYRGHQRGRVATEKSVGSVTLEDVKSLHGDLLGGSSWVAGAVGDFDAAEMAVKMESRFGRLKFSRSERFQKPPPPKAAEPETVVVTKKIPQATVVWAAFGPGILDPDRAPLEVADQILGGGGFQSRLTRKIRMEAGMAYSVGSFYTPMEDFGVLGVHAATATQTTGQVLAALTAEIKRAASEPFSVPEIDEAKKTIQNSYIFRFRDPADLVLERMGLTLRGLPRDTVERYYSELDKAKEADVAGAASKVYDPGTGVWVVVGDFRKGDAEFAGFGKVTEGIPE